MRLLICSGVVCTFLSVAIPAWAEEATAVTPATAAPPVGDEGKEQAEATQVSSAPAAPADGVPTVSVPTASAPDTVSDVEAERLAAEIMGESKGDASQSFASSLRFFGFGDFTVSRYIDPGPFASTLNANTLFAVSHVNLYAEGDIAPDWKSMVEVRFLFFPDGSFPDRSPPTASLMNPLTASGGRTVARSSDPSDVGRTTSWAGIHLERAYLEHTLNSYLKVRVGRFLTPWGIWNVDHGSPVIIGPAKPYVVGEEFFPEAQTGFEVLGSVTLGDLTLGYHATLSNGRGPGESYQDLDGNKALGGRLWVRSYWLGQFDLGVSAYGGTVTDRRQQVDVTNKSLKWFNYEHYHELSLAADFRWLWNGLHFQTEAAVHDRAWDDDARVSVDNGRGIQADARRIGWYGLLGYRLPWYNIMPYGLVSYYKTGQRVALGGASSLIEYGGGLNVRVAPSVVIKVQYERATFFDALPGTSTEHALALATGQLAWAF